MQIDAAQFTKIMYAVYELFPPVAPTDKEQTYRDPERKTDHELTPADAELIVAIAQLAVAADRVDDPDERALFGQLTGYLYAHARVSTTAPTLGPVEDGEQRLDHLRSHAAQLQGKPSAALAYSIAYILTISDMHLAEAEDEMLEILREALGLDEEKAGDLLPIVSELITPPE